VDLRPSATSRVLTGRSARARTWTEAGRRARGRRARGRAEEELVDDRGPRPDSPSSWRRAWAGGRVQIWLPAAAEWWRGTGTSEGGGGGERGEESGGVARHRRRGRGRRVVAWNRAAAARVPIGGESGSLTASNCE
jgi:hypothetical protein